MQRHTVRPERSLARHSQISQNARCFLCVEDKSLDEYKGHDIERAWKIKTISIIKHDPGKWKGTSIFEGEKSPLSCYSLLNATCQQAYSGGNELTTTTGRETTPKINLNCITDLSLFPSNNCSKPLIHDSGHCHEEDFQNENKANTNRVEEVRLATSRPTRQASRHQNRHSLQKKQRKERPSPTAVQ